MEDLTGDGANGEKLRDCVNGGGGSGRKWDGALVGVSTTMSADPR